MPRLVRTIALSLCAATLWNLSSAAQTTRPNVLFILADDQRVDTIRAYGNPNIRTPNLDRLVHEGFSFRRNYCMGSMGGAVCVPSRAMMMSGRTLHHVPTDLKGVTTMPEWVRRNGYRAFITGKWHNGEASLLRSFDEGRAVFLGGMAMHDNVEVSDIDDGTLVRNRRGAKFSSELFADAAVEFLEGFDTEDPFFLYVSFTAPHDPRMPPIEYRQPYYDASLPLPENYLPQHPFDNGFMTGRDEVLGPWPRTPEIIRAQLAEYYGMITHMDEQVGRILDALKASGRYENTIIVYAADHGLAIGSHGLLGKQSVYEHSMRAPLIFVGPGIPSAGSTDEFSYLLDIFPTLADSMGITLPEGVEGRSLRPVWEGRTTDAPDSLFLAYSKFQRAVRDDRWKIIRYPQINHTLLFDLKNDPHETQNLATDPDQQERVASMMALLEEWQAKLGDELPLTSEDPDDKAIDFTGIEREPDRWQPDWIVEKYFDE